LLTFVCMLVMLHTRSLTYVERFPCVSKMPRSTLISTSITETD
jgi:hypothetical protein